jgi:hypothetical protein
MTRKYRRTCPECAQAFETVRLDQTFCTPAHKAAFANRNHARGRGGLTQLALAWRAARNRTGDRDAGARAYRELCALLDTYLREDREAGRDPVSYLVGRWRADGTWQGVAPVRLSQPKATQTAPRRPAVRRSNPVVAGRAPAVPISLNQRVVGSNPTSPTIVLP